MRLTIKLVTVLTFGFVLLLTIDWYFSTRWERELVVEDMKADALLLGRVLRPAVEVEYRRGGEAAVSRLLELSAAAAGVDMRWSWLGADDPYGPLAAASPRVVSALENGRTASTSVPGTHRRLLLTTYYPLGLDDGRVAVLVLSQSVGALNRRLVAINRKTTTLIFATAMASGLIALFFGGRLVGRRLDVLMTTVVRIGDGDFSHPAEVPGHDELAALGGAINRMADDLARARDVVREETEARIAAVEQLRQADRLATVGRLASGVAHELGTPLNVVSARAEMIRSRAELPDDVVAGAGIIKAQAGRMTDVLRELLDFARRRPPRKARVDAERLVNRAIALLGPIGRKRNVSIHLDASAAPPVIVADEAQIDQVLSNLIMNAVQAMPTGGTIEVVVGVERVAEPGSEQPPSDFACISVEDEGVGIAKEDLEHVFEPFFTTKDVGEGTGLGLSIAYGIAREHGGWISAESSPGAGSRFALYLPVS